MRTLEQYWQQLKQFPNYHFIIGVCLLAVTMLLVNVTSTIRQGQLVRGHHDYLNKSQTQVQHFLSTSYDQILDQIGSETKIDWSKKISNTFSDHEEISFDLLLLENSKPVYWTSDFFPDQFWKTPSAKYPFLVNYDQLPYWVFHQSIHQEGTQYDWYLSFPIFKYDSHMSSLQLVDLSTNDTLAYSSLQPGIHVSNLSSILSENHSLQTSWIFIYLILFTTLFFIIGIFEINASSRFLHHPIVLLLLKILGSSILLISTCIFLDYNFSHFPLFNQELTSPYFWMSLGSNLVLSIYAMSVSILLIRQIPNQISGKKYNGYFSFLAYLAILLIIIAVTSYAQKLITTTAIAFDFESVFSLDRLSFVGLITIILLFICTFLWSIKLSRIAHYFAKTKRIRFLNIALVLLFSILILAQSTLNIPLFIFLIVACIYLFLLDIFMEIQTPNFTWVVGWIVIISCFSSILLYKYNKDKEKNNRLAMAEMILNTDDPVLNQSSETVLSHIQHQKFGTVSLHGIRKIIQSEATYIDDHYYSTLLADLPKEAIHAKTITLANGRLLVDQDKQGIFYLPIELPNYKSVLQLTQKRTKTTNQTPTLVANQEFKGINGLDQYEYAKYYKGECVDRSNNSFPLNLDSQKTQEESFFQIAKGASILYYSKDNWTILLSKGLSGLIKPLSLFSYMFMISVILMLLILAADSYLNFMPEDLYFKLRRHLSLRNKIQISVVAMIATSFLVVAIVTVVYFKNVSSKENNFRLRRTAINVQKEFESQNIARLDKIFQDDLVDLAKKYDTPISVYGLNGQLHRTSDQRSLNENLIPKLMNFESWQIFELYDENNDVIQSNKNKSTFEFAYFRIIDSKNQPIAYASIPRFPNSTFEDVKANDFMGTLLNVYVFLLLVAGALGLAVANSITKPMSVLGERLKEFKFGIQNEPLEWKNRDEFGDLIHQYNNMMVELQVSANKLAQTEREVAWREMAKQVAHEIKNPLTPMKLSIQHLENRVKSMDKQETEEMVKRVSKTLIEQIDNLSKIAGEFSNFAKIPKPLNEKINLNDLMASVHDLFTKRDEMDFNLYVSIDEIYVYADRGHLLRLLNNLIKNAIQAIPTERRGRIELKLHKDDKNAIIEIKDNGIGIPEKTRQKVFYPNFTTKNSGTGLGLAMCKNIVESFNGSISFQTQNDIGTVFIVRIPLYEGNFISRSRGNEISSQELSTS